MDELMEDVASFVVAAEETGKRLDQVLTTRFGEGRSRTCLQALIEKGCVTLNGSIPKKRTVLALGDEIVVAFARPPDISVAPEPIPLDILYEDAYLLAINKPIGMVVHPAVGHWTGTFVNALAHHCVQQGISLPDLEHSYRPGIVHRLDKDTSGVLLAAKTLQAQLKISELFANRQIYKEYLAVCLGTPGDHLIQAPIGRHQTDRKKMSVTAAGKPATTHCKTLFSNGKISAVSLILETGRMHQIRVHLQHHGTPVLGDQVYGCSAANAKYEANRQLLHARRLQFFHPFLERMIEIVAPPPSDIAHWLQKLEKKKDVKGL